MKYATLYLHIPYCKQACHYCDFHFSTVRSTENEVVERMLREMAEDQQMWSAYEFSSLYFGGGTPSILAPELLERFITRASTLYTLREDAEITLEANPDDITPERLAQWHSIGINRLSVGLQSFDDGELAMMNRAHHANHSLQCLQWISESPIENYTVDLMYGMPGSTVESWQQQLQTLASFRPPHLSCYALTVEEKTVLHHQVKTGKISLPADDVIVKQFEVLDQWANAHGYAHYELSNFAQPGKHSRHNSHYWTGAPYLGIGPGAHSFDGTRRWWNISNNALYAKGAKPTEEQLSPQDLLHERLMVRLRTAAGFNWDNDFPHELGRAERFVLEQEVARAMEQGELVTNDGGFAMPVARWMESDRIIAQLFLD
jgi:oxygen-independent coproporphyrinogen-3 oxidase